MRSSNMMPTAGKRAAHAATIMAYMLAGNVLTSMTAVTALGLVDLHSRIKDLKDSGIPVTTDVVREPGTMYCRYYIAASDRSKAIEQLRANGGYLGGKKYVRKKKHKH